METIKTKTGMYKIILNDLDSTEFRIGLSIEQMMEFKLEHFAGVKHDGEVFKFYPVEMSELEVLNFNKINRKEKEELFQKTLSPSQKNDISIGKKRIGYNSEIGFHLVVNKEFKEKELSGVGFSNAEIEAKRNKEVLILLKSAIRNERESVFSLLNLKYPNLSLSEKEYEDAISIITKI